MASIVPATHWSEMSVMFSSYFSKRCIPIQIQKPRVLPVVSAVATPNSETRERLKLKELFQEARDRCEDAPMNGISFSVEDFEVALKKYDFDIEIGSVVRGTVVMTDEEGAVVGIRAKSLAYLPTEEACIHEIEHVQDAGVVPGLTEEFLVIDQNEDDDSFILSLKSIQYDIAWERCRQIQAENAVVKGKVVDTNSGGLVVKVEGLKGFVPFSQISMKSEAEELLEKEIPLKFINVDEEQSMIVLSNRRAIADSLTDLGVGSVVIGTVQSIKRYGAFVDIGGIIGLLHVSQISHDHVTDISTVLQPGDTLKVMILSHDPERDKLSLSTKKLEPTPGDMIRNPQLVFEKAEEMVQTFRQRIAQAEAMARADMVRVQSESGSTLSREGILGVLGLASDSHADSLDLRHMPPADV